MDALKILLKKPRVKFNIISPREARQMMKDSDNYVLLDVRAPSEYAQVRIDGAKLIPVDELGQRAPEELPDKHIPILVYCHSGMRAERAAEMLVHMGYTEVFSFGGIMNWPYETVKG